MSKILSTSTRSGSNTTKLKLGVQYGIKYFSAKFENSPYDLCKLETGPPTSTELTKEDALSYLKTMQLIRFMEKEIGNLYVKKKVRGFCHLYSGQEAVSVGVKSAMLPQDTALTSYRCHAWVYLMGSSIRTIISELLAGESGCSRGKGGSMHLYGPYFYGGNAIVGSQVPLGTGLALGHKYKNDGGVCVTIFGDGAFDQGQVFEAMNQAKLLSLPVLYLAENNIYSMGTPLTRHSANTDLYTKSDCVPGIRLDGMDVLCVREGAKFCFDYIRSGNGPIVLEALTYRYFGHSMSDPGTTYRTREEVSQVRATKDPIMLLKNKILSSELATEDELKNVGKEAKAEVDSALKEALKDKEVAVEELWHDVYNTYSGKIRLPGFNKFVEHKNGGAKKLPNQKLLKKN